MAKKTSMYTALCIPNMMYDGLHLGMALENTPVKDVSCILRFAVGVNLNSHWAQCDFQALDWIAPDWILAFACRLDADAEVVSMRQVPD